jgi:hypothetical protein
MKAVLSVVAANVKLDQRPMFLMVRTSSVKTATRILILPSASVVARSVKSNHINRYSKFISKGCNI